MKKKMPRNPQYRYYLFAIVSLCLTAVILLLYYLYRPSHALPAGSSLTVSSIDPDRPVDFFYLQGNDLFQLNTNSLESSELFTLEAGPQDILDAFLSPSGDYLAYTAFNSESYDGDIFVVDMQSQETQNISNSPDVTDGSLDWSPDGRYLAYYHDGGNDMDIYISNVEGTYTLNLTDNYPYVDSSPRWSPDGSQLLVLSSRPSNRNEWGIDIYTIEGLETNHPQIESQRLLENIVYIMEADWSPDGQWIAYKTNEPDALWLMPSDASAEPVIVSVLASRTDHFSWSPDSQWLVYDAMNTSARYDLQLTNIGTMEAENLTKNPDTNEQYPSWLSNGLILYHDDKGLLSLINFQTGEIQELNPSSEDGLFRQIVGWLDVGN